MADDLISRQVAIDAFYAQSDDDGWWMGTVEDFERFINGLPTAQRQIENAYKEGYFDCQQEWLRQKETHLTSIEINEGGIVGKFTERTKGKWIVIMDEPTITFDECKCSVCGVVEYFNKGWKKFSYCPNCGAEMKGENEVNEKDNN